ncbi:nitroreductase family protein [Gaoshiqia sp. Z1-71]|uniref:nitroreductase family protein n=1 Tax=Gaoshiqia hydrogeniformans TaxID=3290090 RepID=UPI003BF91162
MEEKKEQVSAWIKNRRSTFVNGLKEGSKIDDRVIEQVLENAVWAPSHGLVQAWQFKVFAGKAVKRFFAVQKEIYQQITPPEQFYDFKYEAYDDKWKRVSHVIAVIARRDPHKRFPKQEDLVSVACAVQNIYLSLGAFGIGGYLSTGDICYSPPMRDFLGLHEDDEPLGFFILGEVDETFRRPQQSRVPAADKTEWIRH